MNEITLVSTFMCDVSAYVRVYERTRFAGG